MANAINAISTVKFKKFFPEKFCTVLVTVEVYQHAPDLEEQFSKVSVGQ